VLVQERQVDGLDGLEVRLAVGVARGLLAVDVVVVQREGHRVHPVDAQLDREALGEGGLPRGRRAGDGDQLDALAGHDLVGDLGDALLVERLGHLDDLQDAAGDAQLVEAPDAGDPEISFQRRVSR
jgi:hypothetical protein